MAKIIVLGAGLVGGVMARDLSKDHEVISVDISRNNLDKLEGIKTVCSDVSKTDELHRIIDDCDLVVGAVPGFMGYKMMRDVIDLGRNIVDISFYSEDPFGLDELAKKKGVVAVMDCGVAPGMGNIIFGYHDGLMKITDYECLVGGLPVKREWPYEYQAVFSPIDVIEEYVRPARFVQNSKIIIKEALSDTEIIDFDEIGQLESWNSDGLRSLIRTMKHVPNMIEKTLRYPSSFAKLRRIYQSDVLIHRIFPNLVANLNFDLPQAYHYTSSSAGVQLFQRRNACILKYRRFLVYVEKPIYDRELLAYYL